MGPSGSSTTPGSSLPQEQLPLRSSRKDGTRVSVWRGFSTFPLRMQTWKTRCFVDCLLQKLQQNGCLFVITLKLIGAPRHFPSLLETFWECPQSSYSYAASVQQEKLELWTWELETQKTRPNELIRENAREVPRPLPQIQECSRKAWKRPSGFGLVSIPQILQNLSFSVCWTPLRQESHGAVGGLAKGNNKALCALS